MAAETAQRPALSRQIGLPRHTVSDLLANLESRGLVQTSGDLGGLPGRSQLTYALRPSAALSLGFDIGGTKVAGALCDIRGTILAEQSAPTARTGATALVEQIAGLADRLCRDAGLPRFQVRNTAIGVPAAVHPQTGALTLAGNLPGLEDPSLADRLSHAMSGKLHLDNDVNLALLAELAHGVAKGRRNVIFIALGTGIGAALMIDGHLLRGAFGGAGEIGYAPLWQLEPAGTASLENRVGEAGIRQHYVALGGDAAYTVRDIFDAAARGEAAAAAALDTAAETVVRALVAALCLVDPDLVVFGGSIGARSEFIDRVRIHASAAWMRPVDILRSNAGGRAGLLGALDLARQNMLDDLFGVRPAD